MLKTTDPLALETIFSITHDLKKLGKRIGFTHGAFDLFHYGHLNFLREAAKRCDFLVVGLDADKFIKQYKSPSRPIIPAKSRLHIVSELACVGAAFVNDVAIYDGWVDIGRELKTDLLFTGKAYAIGEEMIRQRAGKMRARYMCIRHDFETTTDIINRIIETRS